MGGSERDTTSMYGRELKDSVINGVAALFNSFCDMKIWVAETFLGLRLADLVSPDKTLSCEYAEAVVGREIAKRNRGLDQLDKFILPLFFPGEKGIRHWAICVLSPVDKIAKFHDSVPCPLRAIRAKSWTFSLIDLELRACKDNCGPITAVGAGWKFVVDKASPTQQTDHECGIFVLAHMYSSLNKMDSFEAKNLANLRIRVAYDLLQGCLH